MVVSPKIETRNQHSWHKVSAALDAAAAPIVRASASREAALSREADAVGDKSGGSPCLGMVFPGASLCVAHNGNLVYNRTVGCRSLVPEVTPARTGLVYDVASLTKVIVTTTLAMKLVERGQLDLDWRLSRIFQTFGSHGKESMTIRHLLSHTSGYPPTSPFYKSIAKTERDDGMGSLTSRAACELIQNEVFRAKLDNLPGKVTRYSDIGFILLGRALETITGLSLDKLAQREVFQPLGLRSTGYIDLTSVRRKGVEPVVETIAPTARCSWRGRILCGEVHDDNAWAMGGIAPHSGVFSTAEDICIFAEEMLRCYRGESSFIDRAVVRTFWSRAKVDPESSWALGWDTPSHLVESRVGVTNSPGHSQATAKSSSGRYFSSGSVGHLAFTGCSLWIDVNRNISVVLLSNRIHPSVDNLAIREFRPIIHDLVMEALGATG